jgi:hypothetical protein
MAGPLLVVAMCSKFTAVTAFSSKESIVESKRIIQCASLLRLAGLTIILWWFITFSKDGFVFLSRNVDGVHVEGLVSYTDLVSNLIGFLGSTMFQAVLWTDIIVHVARNDNVKIKKLETDLA